MSVAAHPDTPWLRWRELAVMFLRLGITSFGGPAAHLAVMEDEVVTRRQWLTRAQFLDLVGAAHLIPGPTSTEVAMHIGRVRGGGVGLVVAGTCFILPAALLVAALAWGYVRYGALPAVAGILYGVKPVVIAVVVQALWRLGQGAVKTRALAAIGVAATVAGALGLHELLVLAAAGLAVVVLAAVQRGHRGGAVVALAVVPAAGGATSGGVAATVGVGAVAVSAASVGLWPLFLFFLKVGSVLVGSGYVLLAFLRADLIERWHWLNETQLLDAVAVGQITPGPVFTAATFIGYLVAGPPGAVVATVGIFLPAFIYVALSAPLLPWARRSWVASAVLDGVNIGSLALMAVVTWQLARGVVTDWVALVMVGVSAVVLLRFKVNATWLLLAGALLGLALTWRR